MPSLVFPLPRLRSRLRAPVRQFAFWSPPAPPPYTEFPLVSPVATEHPYTAQSVPQHIARPQYADTGRVDQASIPKSPVIWSEYEISKIRDSCQLARSVLESLRSIVEPGVTTDQLDLHARDLIIQHNAYPSLLNFEGFTKSISTSVNNVAAHGVPDSRPLQAGDILNIDVTVFLDGFHGDVSDTFAVGEVDRFAERLIEVTRETLRAGIDHCGPGRRLTMTRARADLVFYAGAMVRGVGHAIHRHVKKHNFVTIPIFMGHGLGTFLHGPPDIYHCLNNIIGKMVPGMIFTVEPVVGEGGRRIRQLEDGWTWVTADCSRTAQMEQTVLITEHGAEILTGKT